MEGFIVRYFKVLLFFTAIYFLIGLYFIYQNEKSFEGEVARKITSIEKGSRNMVVVSPIGVQTIPFKEVKK